MFIDLYFDIFNINVNNSWYNNLLYGYKIIIEKSLSINILCFSFDFLKDLYS